jgi:PTH1 family peptidyl-tRNA hydrolase
MEPDFKSIKLIIGLGNPVKEYENTYHNIGLLALNYIAKKFKLNVKDKKSEKYFDYLKLNLNQKTYYLIFPKTYMNASGLALKEAIKKFKVLPQNILILQDESDLNIGKFKYAFKSGSAGHHGIESIINLCKSNEFWRLRIGIRPKESKLKAEKFVLKKIGQEDKKIFYYIFEGLITKLIEKTLPASEGLISEKGKSIDTKN